MDTGFQFSMQIINDNLGADKSYRISNQGNLYTGEGHYTRVQVLCIPTSKWVLRTPFAGRNHVSA